jgi:hypothetical protein
MSTKTSNGSFIVFAESWTEYERGWGSRYDGHTFHLSKEHRDRFVKAYWDRTKKDQVPDEYSTPDENLFPTEVDAELYNAIVESVDGAWGPRNPKKWVG